MVPADQIIKISVPDQGIRADCIWFSVIAQYLLFVPVKFWIEKRNLLPLIDCFIDRINDIVAFFIS